MSDTPTFRLGDLVWIAEVESITEMPHVLHKEAFILLHGIVKKVQRDGKLITVLWYDNHGNTGMSDHDIRLTDHIANNLAYTADEAIQKFTEWARNELNAQKHAYEKEAVEKQAKTQANDAAPAVFVYGLDEDQLRSVIAAIKEKQ